MERIIEYNDWILGDVGIENNIAHIRLNTNLPKWKTLYKHVLEHENKHILEYEKHGTLLTPKNFIQDLIGDLNPKIILLTWLFFLCYPKSMGVILPIHIKNNVLYFYPFNLVIYIIILVLITPR
jgi:hypothetical protein